MEFNALVWAKALDGKWRRGTVKVREEVGNLRRIKVRSGRYRFRLPGLNISYCSTTCSLIASSRAPNLITKRHIECCSRNFLSPP